jgi:hypothetical protein
MKYRMLFIHRSISLIVIALAFLAVTFAFVPPSVDTFSMFVSRSLTKMSIFPSSKDSKNELSSEKNVPKFIDNVVNTLRRDKSAQLELGNLLKVNNVLGYGSPKPGIVALRFNASFQKSGKGLSAKPMPFGLGQTNQSEGRGTMVGQVKAVVDAASGRVLECTVFRDLGYGRAFDLKLSK